MQKKSSTAILRLPNTFYISGIASSRFLSEVSLLIQPALDGKNFINVAMGN
jgi:hypothetical protein